MLPFPKKDLFDLWWSLQIAIKGWPMYLITILYLNHGCFVEVIFKIIA